MSGEATGESLKEKSFFAAKCGACGFEYREYDGHIIPCPRCRAETAVAALKAADEILAVFTTIKNSKDLYAEAAEAAEILADALTELGL